MLYAVYHIARADFLERVRRLSFLIVLGIVVWVTFLAVPPSDSNFSLMVFDNSRGIYNAAWIGAAIALNATMLLTLMGFYLVKNAVQRDISTGVGQIIDTTPVSKLNYFVGKTVSNFAVLATIVLAVIIMSGVLLFVRGEDKTFDLAGLVLPFLVFTLPTMFLVAALAVFFEAVPFLRGSAGNIIYFFLYITILSLAVVMIFVTRSAIIDDPFGIKATVSSITAVCKAVAPDCANKVSIGGGVVELATLKKFQWNGIAYTGQMLLSQLFWLLVAGGLIALSALVFPRFDSRPSTRRRDMRAALQVLTGSEPAVAEAAPDLSIRLTPLTEHTFQWRIGAVVKAEILQLLQGQRWWWYLILLGIFVAGLFVPAQNAMPVIAAAFVWPLVLWSTMGARETVYKTNQIVFITPQVIWRQLFAHWLSGVVVALIAVSGIAVRLLVEGDPVRLFSLVVGSLFAPTLALALGVWSNNEKLYQIVFLLLCYIGILNSSAIFDFAGTRAYPPLHALTYLIVTMLLLVIAALGRRRQIVIMGN